MPFTAVVISLMGDGPDSLDSIIVSSCIVLEDETSEKQVDGIVKKVSWQTSWFIFLFALLILIRLTRYKD